MYTIADLASATLTAAASAVDVPGPSGLPAARFCGGPKVFIAHVYSRLPSKLRTTMSLETYKLHLVEANQIGLVRLARADLVGAMDRTAVAHSKVSSMGCTFHFVVDASHPLA